jgi:hypothetical protein
MRSRAARLAIGAAALVAIGAAAFFLFRSEQQTSAMKSTLRAFDVRAREATDALAELRVAQQAYVAEGQGVAFWMPKVTTLHEAVAATLAALRQGPVSSGTRTALDEAAATVAEFGNIDQKARDYIKGGQQLMAADVIFTEGGETTATARRHVETARLAEHQAVDAAEAALRKNEALAAGGAAGVAVLVVLLLIPMAKTSAAEPETVDTGLSITSIAGPAPVVKPAEPVPASRNSTVLKAAASLATDLGRVRDADEMTRLLGRAATLMDASGIVIWLGNTTGSDLHPILAHGYGAQALSRMPPVPRTADNAAGAAYRTGQMQIVLSRPGGAPGAIVAPILSADGCIGALSAEIQGGSETSESIQALATIFAAHLAPLFTAPPETAEATSKTAAHG